MTNLPANIQTALTERSVDIAVWTTLKNSVFPGAKDESVLLAIDYCKARKMDILKKPCHIVPMCVTLSGEKEKGKDGNYYDKKVWRDVIMPGIYEQRITAFRTGQMAGQDEPLFGENIEYLGNIVPEWCKVTVYRFVNGERCSFSHTEYFVEACATTEIKENKQSTGKYRLNSMWTKRPRGQLAKCAEAGALRKAFPDELGGVITADEVDTEQSTNTTNMEVHKDTKPPIQEAEIIELASNEQIAQIHQLLELTQSDLAKALAYYGVSSVEQMSKLAAENFIKKLNTKLDEQSAAQNNQAVQGEEVQL